jgi:hypothetical protein
MAKNVRNELDANKFEAVGLGAPESLNGKRVAPVGMLGDAKNAAR